MSSFRVPGLSRIEIYNFVQRILVALKLEQNGYYMDVVAFVESIHTFDDLFAFECVEKNELPIDTYARYLPIDNKMEVDEDVCIAACNGDKRHRFTIAHELGHYFLHGDKIAFNRVPPGRIIKAYEDPEWQANTFASYLLVSPSSICELKTAENISKKCGVSYQAAKIALENAKKAKH